MPYRDRRDAGRVLATYLTAFANRTDVLVFALPRGGVPVAFEVAEALGAPLDVFLVRKLGVPGHEELAMGAIASGGVQVPNENVLRQLEIPTAIMEAVATREQQELVRRERAYRDGRPAPDVHDRVVLLVDDGLATGTTMRAAVVALRAHGPARLVAAVPVAARETCVDLAQEVDEMICAATPDPFYAVGLWYENFAPTTDEEVHNLLANAARVYHQPPDASRISHDRPSPTSSD